MAAFANTPGTGRIPVHRILAPASFPSQVVMANCRQALCLSKLNVPRLLIIIEKFIRLANANYPEELLLTHCMDGRVLSIVC